MKFLLIMIAVLLAATGVTMFAMNEAGYVLLGFGTTSIELPLIDFVVLLIALLLVLFLVVKFIAGIFGAPKKIGTMRAKSKAVQSRRGLIRGLIEMAGGDWVQAEKSVLKNVKNSETPLLNYLIAAHAAQQQENPKARDDYIRRAISADPQAEIAVGLTQAELQIRQKQYEEALATLQRLDQIAPRHKFVKKQMGRLFFKLKDWQSLSEILPALRKMNVLKPEELIEMEVVTFCARLEKASDMDRLKKIWNELPSNLQTRSELVRVYARLLLKQGGSKEAEKLITQSLDKKLDGELLKQYSGLSLEDPTAALNHMEKWLKKDGHNPDLLMAIGRVSLQARLWGKARSVLNQSIAIKPTAEAYQALADLHEQTGEDNEALVAYKTGLGLSLRSQSA